MEIIIIIIIRFVDFIMICPYKYNYIDSLNLKLKLKKIM